MIFFMQNNIVNKAKRVENNQEWKVINHDRLLVGYQIQQNEITELRDGNNLLENSLTSVSNAIKCPNINLALSWTH